ncbi:MAG: ABC transporter ATP-binding protein [Succinivibrio sp.]|nr:ABC transporter ATP-binding protein [Succinivibrio sp.]
MKTDLSKELIGITGEFKGHVPLLEVSGISVTFGGLHALSDVSFTVEPNEIIGIIGPNGAGKTTLFNSLVGLQKLSSGHVNFEGKRISGHKPHSIAAAGMTKTFQNSALFPGMSVLDNVITAALLRNPLKTARQESEKVLKKLGLYEVKDTDVADLTFPQKALTELARGLASGPRLLLLDEVMAALSPSEMDDVIGVIKEIRKSMSVSFLVVEHHMRAIMALCDRLIVLNFGKKLAEGTPQEIAKNPQVVEAYLGSSASVLGGEHAA